MEIIKIQKLLAEMEFLPGFGPKILKRGSNIQINIQRRGYEVCFYGLLCWPQPASLGFIASPAR
jgi:hypothetical protein